MITLYTWKTPNGRKIPIALEELGLAYEVVPVDFSKKEQKSDWYLKINPNGKIPAIVDHDGTGGEPITIFESAAILEYLAEKKPGLLATEPRARFEALEWLAFQVSAIGPYVGLLGSARRSEKRDPEAEKKYEDEVRRELSVLNRQLEGREYLASSGFSIADVAMYPWLTALKQIAPELVDEAPRVKAWLERVGTRPAVKKGMTIP